MIIIYTYYPWYLPIFFHFFPHKIAPWIQIPAQFTWKARPWKPSPARAGRPWPAQLLLGRSVGTEAEFKRTYQFSAIFTMFILKLLYLKYVYVYTYIHILYICIYIYINMCVCVYWCFNVRILCCLSPFSRLFQPAEKPAPGGRESPFPGSTFPGLLEEPLQFWRVKLGWFILVLFLVYLTDQLSWVIACSTWIIIHCP